MCTYANRRYTVQALGPNPINNDSFLHKGSKLPLSVRPPLFHLTKCDQIWAAADPVFVRFDLCFTFHHCYTRERVAQRKKTCPPEKISRCCSVRLHLPSRCRLPGTLRPQQPNETAASIVKTPPITVDCCGVSVPLSPIVGESIKTRRC